MTPAQLRQLLTAARKDPAFEAYIQRKRAQVQVQIERKQDERLRRTQSAH